MLTVSAPPFVKKDTSAADILWATIAALLPTIGLSIYVHGTRALHIYLACIGSALITEIIIQYISGKQIRVLNGSAIITGILIALLLPYYVPLWIAVIGGIFAIAIVKEAFGGTGSNVFNPALASWVFLMMSWAIFTVTIPGPVNPYIIINYNAIRLGEVSPILIMIPLLILILIRYVDWRTPLSYFVSTVVLLFLLKQSFDLIFTGIFMVAVFFFVTDPVTTPVTKRGRLIFGAGCGLLTVLYTMNASYVEGIGLSILLMNAISPLIDRFTIPKPIIAGDTYEDL